MELPYEFTKLLLNSLEVNLALILLIISSKIIGEKDAWVVKSFHNAQR